jgi:hypothetical protein
MKNILLLAIILALFIQFSCSSYITPALGGATSIGYIARPTVIDSVSSMTSISGSYITAEAKGADLYLNLAEFSLNKGFTTSKFNFGYGIFGVIGKATYSDENINSNNSSSFTNEFNNGIYGYGIRATVGFHTINKSERVSFRILNWENSYSVEKGSYANYRKDLYDSKQSLISDNRIYVSNFTKIYTTGFSSEILFNDLLNKSAQANIRLFYGFSPGYKESFRAINGNNDYLDVNNRLLGCSLFFKSNKFNYLAEVLSDANLTGRLTLGYNLCTSTKK